MDISIIFRISTFVLSSKILERIRKTTDIDVSDEDEISFNDMLSAFGKVIVIMVYTHSWIDQYEQSVSIDYAFWRWLNIFVSLSLYFWNLMTPIDQDVISRTFE